MLSVIAFYWYGLKVLFWFNKCQGEDDKLMNSVKQRVSCYLLVCVCRPCMCEELFLWQYCLHVGLIHRSIYLSHILVNCWGATDALITISFYSSFVIRSVSLSFRLILSYTFNEVGADLNLQLQVFSRKILRIVYHLALFGRPICWYNLSKCIIVDSVEIPYHPVWMLRRHG